MPKLWSETIETHRREVRYAILDATWELVAEHGLLSVTMSQIAEEAGIGRATLYKYFPDVEAILLAWHDRQITDHLEQLAEVRNEIDDPGRRLEAVLEAYAHIRRERVQHPHFEPHGAELVALLHRDEAAHGGGHRHLVTGAQHQVRVMLRELLTEAASSGHVRDDVAPDELASYCLNAVGAAGSLPSKAAVRRLVAVTLAGLRPPR